MPALHCREKRGKWRSVVRRRHRDQRSRPGPDLLFDSAFCRMDDGAQHEAGVEASCRMANEVDLISCKGSRLDDVSAEAFCPSRDGARRLGGAFDHLGIATTLLEGVTEHIGDAVMAVFGSPIAREDDARRASDYD